MEISPVLTEALVRALKKHMSVVQKKTALPMTVSIPMVTFKMDSMMVLMNNQLTKMDLMMVMMQKTSMVSMMD